MSMKFLEMQWPGPRWDILSKVKENFHTVLIGKAKRKKFLESSNSTCRYIPKRSDVCVCACRRMFTEALFTIANN